MTSATPGGGDDRRPRLPHPPTRPLPVPGDAGGPGWRPGPGRRWRPRQLAAALRTPRGAGTAATVAGAAVMVAVGLTTSPPTGVVELEADTGTPGPGLRPGLVVTAAAAAADEPPTGATADVVVRLVGPASPGAPTRRAPAEVGQVQAAVDAGSLPAGCPADAVVVWAPTGPLTVDLTTGVPVGAGLRAGAPAACRGARVVVSGTATAIGLDARPVRLAVSGVGVLPVGAVSPSR